MEKQPKNKETFLTTEAVSKWLRVSTKTINHWAETKEIPAVKVGGEWKFRESDLTRWVKKRTENKKRPD
jgi:excisionase family DNA binding protein